MCGVKVMICICLVVKVIKTVELVYKMADETSDDTSYESPKREELSPKKELSPKREPPLKAGKSTKDNKSVNKKGQLPKTLKEKDSELIDDGTPFKKTKPIPPKLMKEMEEQAAVRNSVNA